ncbi:MAG: hypothetical protein WCV90_06920 [Candidatus Woesearchaeota archaeon]
MLPDFPVLKSEIKKRFNEYIRLKSNADPLLSAITKIHILEGDKLVYYTIEGIKKETTFDEFKSKFSVHNQEIIDNGVNGFISAANEVSSDIQSQLGRKIFSTFDKITEETGNRVDAKGKELSSDVFLEALEKMEIDFDDNGNPCMPTMFVSPELGKKIQENLPIWEKDLEHKKKFEDLMKKKKEEWNDRESNRTLVD